MPTGFAILFALFVGVPLFLWAQGNDPVAGRGLDIALSFLLCTAVSYGLGWLFGFSIRKIKGG